MTYNFHVDGTLPQNGEVFVFGSNLAGIHGAGAAKVAVEKFGAIYGRGFGLQEQSYAIPTKNAKIHTMSLDDIEAFIIEFKADTYDSHNAERTWFVTRVGCGLAGYSDSQIAPMFKGAKNCSFAKQWKPYLENENGI